MFSPNIVESDAFLEMPSSSQALYFHLGMEADDDGFVNPRRIMRTMSASEDDLKVIITKRFVLPFENGVVVLKHWRINNLIQKDRYHPTIYQEQFLTLKVKENGAYTESVNRMLPEVRLGKDRLVEEILPEREISPKTAAFKKEFLDRLKAKASSPSKASSPKQTLSAEIVEWAKGLGTPAAKQIGFGLVGAYVRDKGEQFVRECWASAKQSNARDPAAIFMSEYGKVKMKND